jgi:hypothetical protein
MASKKKGTTKSTSDRPMVTTQSLKRLDAPAGLQYKVSGMKSSTRSPKKMGREMAR